MKRAILMFALFPFLHATNYEVDYVSCKPNEIIVAHEDEQVQIHLFNTKIIKEEGWNKTCSILEKAKKIRIEIDPSSKVEQPIPVYLFADGILVQEELIKKGFAYPMIKNPEYTYEERLEKAFDTTQTMAKPALVSNSKKGQAKIAPIFLGIVLLVWGLMLARILFLHNKKRKNLRKRTGKT